MKGWLDNYNDSKVSVPQGFVGDGYNTKGRNYSPAWGGQFQDGGFIPIAQRGRDIPATRADSLAVYNDAVNSKNYYEKTYSKFYEKPKVLKYDPTFWRMEQLKKDHLEHDQVTPANKQKIRQNKNPNQYLISDMITGAIDPKAPLLRYDKRIKPQGLIDYTPKNYLVKEFEKLDKSLFDDKNDKLRRVLFTAIRGSQMNKSEKALYDKWKAKHPHDLKNLRKLSDLDDYIGNNTPGYITTLPYYDLLAVKPFNLLTDAEKKVRVKKYGPSGVPKSYLNANKIKLNVDPKPNPNKKLNLDPKPKQEVVQPDLPMVEAVNLPPMQQLQSINPPAISDSIRAPKSYDVSTQRYNMQGPSDYYSYDKKDAGYEDILKANAAAKAYNKDIEKRYGPQNEYRTEKSRQEAARRLEQLRQDVKVTPNYQMGGSIPGAVGFSYARTQSPAPDNGPYAKKTMASAKDGAWLDQYDVAQNGIKKPLPSYKEFKESLKKDKVVDYKERPVREMVRDNTRVVFRDEKGRQKTANPNKQVSTKYNAVKEAKQKEQETKAMLADRKARIADSILAQDEDIIGNPNWREVMARETQATGDKFRLFPEEDSFFDDYLNPAVMIGNMASDLGNAPLRAQQEDSYMPYVTSIGVPLLTGGIEGIGASSNRQFVNNIANPFNVVPGYSSARKYVGNKLGKATSNFESQLVQNFPKKGSLLPVMNEHLSGIGLGIKDVAKGRPFFETFPITQAQRQASDIAQNKAMQEGVDFVDDWFYKNGEIRPNVRNKIDNMTASDPYLVNNDYTNNPLLNMENRLVSSRSNDLPFENISDQAKEYIESRRGGILGVNFGDTESITLRNMGMYKFPPSNIKSTVVHEAGHSAQNIGDYNRFGNLTTVYSPDFKYYTSNPSTAIGQRFKNALRTPTKPSGDSYSHRTWLSSPNELHSDLMSARSNMYDDFLKQGKNPEEAMDLLQNPSDETLDALIKTGGLDQFFKQSRWGKSRVPIETKRDLLRMLPAAVPLTVGATALQQQKDGGVIKDDMGQWAHPGEITEIGSNQITMEGVPYPVLGISDTGDMQMMYPEEDYEFDGESVTEYPMAKNGIRQEQKGLVNLDQLTNFTNYNKPQPGGWLNKYN